MLIHHYHDRDKQVKQRRFHLRGASFLLCLGTLLAHILLCVFVRHSLSVDGQSVIYLGLPGVNLVCETVPTWFWMLPPGAWLRGPERSWVSPSTLFLGPAVLTVLPMWCAYTSTKAQRDCSSRLDLGGEPPKSRRIAINWMSDAVFPLLVSMAAGLTVVSFFWPGIAGVDPPLQSSISEGSPVLVLMGWCAISLFQIAIGFVLGAASQFHPLVTALLSGLLTCLLAALVIRLTGGAEFTRSISVQYELPILATFGAAATIALLSYFCSTARYCRR